MSAADKHRAQAEDAARRKRIIDEAGGPEAWKAQQAELAKDFKRQAPIKGKQRRWRRA